MYYQVDMFYTLNSIISRYAGLKIFYKLEGAEGYVDLLYGTFIEKQVRKALELGFPKIVAEITKIDEDNVDLLSSKIVWENK